ncbi:MAG: hypothetical protein OQL06_12115 [Gammaproteobacteria bacterium]|nr:hypothetical protein [Gammaproteobacteria bacterium]
MKLAVYLAALSLTATLGTAFAVDMVNADDDIPGYCNEQAELSGIEDMDEKTQYIQDCIDSYGPPIDSQQSGE